MLRRNLSFFCFLLSMGLGLQVQAAPRVPEFLTENGLTYCTNASGFSFNPQTADAGTSMNVVTEQIYNKLFEIKNHSANVTPVLAQSYSISPDGKEILINLRHGVKFHQTPIPICLLLRNRRLLTKIRNIKCSTNKPKKCVFLILTALS